MSWKRLSRNVIHESRFMTMWLDEVELPNGKKIEYSGADLPDGVMVVATNPQGELLMLDEYKYAMGDVFTLIPAGGIDRDEDPIEAARRELLEETGYTSDEFEFVGTNVPYPSKIRETCSVVRALNVRRQSEISHEETEEIRNIRFVSSEKFRETLHDKSIQLTSVIAAVAIAAPEFIAEPCSQQNR